MAGYIGNLENYYSWYNWECYQERMVQYLIANDINDTKWSAVLITGIGLDAYQTLKHLCFPDAPKDKSFDELCQILHKHYSPNISVFRQRTVFYASRQNENKDSENVITWYTRIKCLAKDCKFGENLDQILLDQFVIGMQKGHILERLCEEKETLTLDIALEIAINIESALAQTDGLNAETNTFRKFDNEPAEPIKLPKKRRGRGRGGKQKKDDVKENSDHGEDNNSEENEA